MIALVIAVAIFVSTWFAVRTARRYSLPVNGLFGDNVLILQYIAGMFAGVAVVTYFGAGYSELAIIFSVIALIPQSLQIKLLFVLIDGSAQDGGLRKEYVFWLMVWAVLVYIATVPLSAEGIGPIFTFFVHVIFVCVAVGVTAMSIGEYSRVCSTRVHKDVEKE